MRGFIAALVAVAVAAEARESAETTPAMRGAAYGKIEKGETVARGAEGDYGPATRGTTEARVTRPSLDGATPLCIHIG
jgi:hypothetical protein